MSQDRPLRQRMPVGKADQAENLEFGAWAAFAVGVVLSFFSGLGVLLCLGAVGLLVSVAIREQRGNQMETRRRLQRVEAFIEEQGRPRP